MLKTQQKLARLKTEIAQQGRRQQAQKLAARKERKADQQRTRNAAKARERALESHQPSPLNLAQNPLRTDRDEQKRAGRIRWRLETETGEEVRTLAGWCSYIAQETGAVLTAVDLEAILRAEGGFTLPEIVRCLSRER